ncbi:DUF4124 domain-containing protein [Atopomonas sediminilitoris]|uniref:DUF4124 domain-containing protein n=1 Tax=Atopomonas sediminilitoris TaxID=2919919 RepID=UPI001F4EC6AD|nr:DUF4124 domain-containing protein [Atopomonas sediminilitoris]MCJ8168426.1 DUF4124 domain-containing protein [Atopomonas sediminilitoris]
MRRATAVLFLAFPLLVSAQVYRYTDANGNVVLTDKPPQDVQAESVDVRTPNSVKVEPSNLPPALKVDAAPKQAYQRLEITSPNADQAVRANNGDFDVALAIEPPLAKGHLLQVLVDGSAMGEPSRGPLTLSNVERGTHQLQVVVLAGEKEIQRSNSVTITVQRVALGTPKPTLPLPKATP